MPLKYVIINEVAPRLGTEMEAHFDFGRGATSAGFFDIEIVKETPESFRPDYLRVQCWGESISLGVKSRGKEDASIIERMLNRT
jgi:hypothetical protein